ncbi:IS481 family transposase [Mannheimia haemolytica]|uniref:IS481 family transposase n=2 Tax=Mannheimia haemolytica TaxID=75985 RepID=UPI0002C4EB11|nr:IS481 family transposase [Mannheimia haemolytica]AGI33094.1 IS481 family transposase [Mannheimia haemolytica USDA-ARS-USMARC-183]AGI34936.1 IS481 family transposase [Mannheimia haemolytica USDA-ARS-USMARC-185]AGK01989.1 ISShes15 transposase [Mannheimia haemolytica M42548]AGR74719.1 integrase [Mannheimia haemolytica USMARC_2286]AKA11803.1 integrase [Mannheimia haemolytica]
MFYSNNPLIKHKTGLLNLAEELGNISQACKVMGMSRDTSYRYQQAVEQSGVDALLNQNRRVPNLKNRVDEATEQAVVKFAFDNPAFGQVRVSNELRKQGIFISAGGVRSIWLRHNLANFKQRLNALEKAVAEKGIILSENQVQALERKKEDDVACGEIETAHPGYLGSQDTFYVGNLKGVGRIYQQTFIDTYSKVAFAKLYTMKTAISAADMLNDKVLPFFESQGLPMLRILTDRGSEYCGKVENHDYELYLAINDIEHTKTKVKHPQTNGICERFHKTILQEFYQVAFRKKIYTDLTTLQADLDEWLMYYNHHRTHQGKMCCGRTPMATLLDGKRIWVEKNLSSN